MIPQFVLDIKNTVIFTHNLPIRIDLLNYTELRFSCVGYSFISCPISTIILMGHLIKI